MSLGAVVYCDEMWVGLDSWLAWLVGLSGGEPCLGLGQIWFSLMPQHHGPSLPGEYSDISGHGVCVCCCWSYCHGVPWPLLTLWLLYVPHVILWLVLSGNQWHVVLRSWTPGSPSRITPSGIGWSLPSVSGPIFLSCHIGDISLPYFYRAMPTPVYIGLPKLQLDTTIFPSDHF